jgi:hypothetical protein
LCRTRARPRQSQPVSKERSLRWRRLRFCELIRTRPSTSIRIRPRFSPHRAGRSPTPDLILGVASALELRLLAFPYVQKRTTYTHIVDIPRQRSRAGPVWHDRERRARTTADDVSAAGARKEIVPDVPYRETPLCLRAAWLKEPLQRCLR